MINDAIDMVGVFSRIKALDISMMDLAADAGISHMTLYRWQSGASMPLVSTLRRVIAALDRLEAQQDLGRASSGAGRDRAAAELASPPPPPSTARAARGSPAGSPPATSH